MQDASVQTNGHHMTKRETTPMPKRTPTRPFRSGISDLRKVLEDSFQVRHIAVEIECCDAEDDAQEVRRRMRTNSFDVLGYCENGEVTGYVMQTRLLDGKCRKHGVPFRPNDLVPSNGPLAKLLPMMKNKPRLFVQQGSSVMRPSGQSSSFSILLQP
jgi:hypothetical protein